MLLEEGQVLNKPYIKATGPANLQVSPFTPGDRVNTLVGTGTIYQSGPYDSWIVLDTDWAVHYVRTEFVTHIPGRIEGARPGYPPITHLEAAGYQVRDLVTFTLNGQGLTLSQALEIRESCREGHDPDTQNTFRVAALGPFNAHTVVEATREEPEPYKPVGLGGLV